MDTLHYTTPGAPESRSTFRAAALVDAARADRTTYLSGAIGTRTRERQDKKQNANAQSTSPDYSSTYSGSERALVACSCLQAFGSRVNNKRDNKGLSRGKSSEA